MISQTTTSINHSSDNNKVSKASAIIYINVAVAVIYHQNQYLLGFRNALQHQGNRYEFVGGKIDANETASQALIREVAEETGIDIADNSAVKLGRLHHDYGEKQVCLQVYKVALNAPQYEQHKHRKQGLEGQALTWVDKSKLLAGDYDLPAANKTILEWLRLPQQIVITYPLAYFSDAANPKVAWLKYHETHLAQNAWVYVRLKTIDSENSIEQFLRSRADIQALVPDGFNSNEVNGVITNRQVVAKHLTHTELMQWLNHNQNNEVSHCGIGLNPSTNYPLIISCHDAESIHAANKLACVRLQQQLPPVIAIFLSPVLATQTHPETIALGWQTWSELAVLADMPVIGLGGLSPKMSGQVEQYGGIAVAGIRQFFQ